MSNRIVQGLPWFSPDRHDRRSQDCMVSFRMHAPDQWDLLCTVVEGRADASASTKAEALVARYTAYLSEEHTSRSDTLRQLNWQARIATMNGLRAAERAVERIKEKSFHPPYVVPRVYEGSTFVEELPVVSWDEWCGRRAGARPTSGSDQLRPHVERHDDV